MLKTVIGADFSAIDSTAIVIVIVGLAIVFSALILIYFFFKVAVPAFFRTFEKLKSFRRASGILPVKSNEIQADVTAAIALTIYMQFSETHDEESNVITIKRVSRIYSPWSSKLYSMKNRIR
ncbi:MAG: hypothetical protein MUD02_01195 [Bacteroidales bacterium]|jgi:Na+-transporting methylmalonyl-CoA/oxaloacetate decarboxylase gamma subunit|nr:hypothetical protein [Bacteroidales bacterium]